MKKVRWSKSRAAVAGALSMVLLLGGCGTEPEDPKEEAKVQTAQDHQNVELLRKGYQSFAAGDVPGALALFDDSIVFHIPGTNQLAGDHTGKAVVGATFRQFKELSGGTFKVQPTQIFANEDYGAVLLEVSGTRNGKNIADRPVQVWRFENGEPVEIWLYPGNQKEFDEFWS